MGNLKINRLLSGGIVTNYNCPSNCRHCLYRCGPHRSSDYLDYSTALSLFATVRELGCNSVHIGGGEPLLRPRELGEVLQAASEVGVGIDYVETNCAWFKDADSALQILEDLTGSGLRTLLVSISPFHNEKIPLSKIKGVIKATQKAGVNVIPWVDEFMQDMSGFDPQKTHSLEEYQSKFGEDYLLNILNRYWIHFGGRALDTFRPWFPSKSAEEILSEDKKGCAQELLNTSHFHLDLYGNYIPGLCSGLAIDRQHLGYSLPEEEYPLLSRLYKQGIQGLYEFAGQELGFVPSEDGYMNKCDLCTDIRFHLVQNGSEMQFKELAPRQFYL